MNEACNSSGRICRLRSAAGSTLLYIVAFLFPLTGFARSEDRREVTGIVRDETGRPFPGVTVLVDRSTRGVTTDLDGTFSIRVTDAEALLFSYLGYDQVRVAVGTQTRIEVTMNPKADELEEVTVVGFARQKKESVIASVSTLKPGELRVPASNLTAGIAGRMAGIISYQTSGEPGRDNTNFFIRGVTTFGYSSSPLILIDNIESSTDELARLSVDDVAAFSIMKDATATAIYGARGANGVVLVTTREGREGPARLNIRIENSFSTPARNVETVDPVTYMRMYNEAVTTRNPTMRKPFSEEKIAYTRLGANPYVYPAVDWYEELFSKVAVNQRANVNISGGGKVARYFISTSFSNDNGSLKVDNRNDYNNNINIKRIQIRSNININLTKTTSLGVRVTAHFDNYNGPIDNGDVLYRKVRSASPVHFPKYFEPDEANRYADHILFGNYDKGDYLNPYADMIKGYRETNTNTLTAQLELNEDLKYITPGLKLRGMFNATRYSTFGMTRTTSPFFYAVDHYDKPSGRYTLSLLNPDGGHEDLRYTPADQQINSTYYFEGAVTYAREFGRHNVGALLVGTMRNYLTSKAPTVQESLPSRNMGLSGRVTYAYDSRYLFEANFGYNGSERFSKRERFGFFPSAGVGYIVSNEGFWPENKIVNKLKIKATYGLVGNDKIGDARDRFYYISEVLMNNGLSRIPFGENFTENFQTIALIRYGNPYITWEVARKFDLGAELTLFDFLELQVDYFSEKRSRIYQQRANIPAELGFAAALSANVGKASSRGFEIQADANKSLSKDFWIGLRGNFTLARSKYDYKEEVPQNYPWLYATGYPIGQMRGYIAERLFIDEADIANSPAQTFGAYMPGDIKYRDINGDDVIDGNDVVPIGYSNVPEITYGYGISLGYKNFDFSCFFQGSSRCSFYIDPLRTTPFLNAGAITAAGDRNIFQNRISPNNVLKSYGESYWSETDRNSYARQPRLTTYEIRNNTVQSTWNLRDGSYMRLKSVEIGYTFPRKWTRKIRMEGLRIYASGLNLFTISKFKDWDVEQGGNGFNYPIQAVYNVGLNINF